jgi:crotonobetaine/carnitine-CoA ligase
MIEMIHATRPSPADRDHSMRRMMCCPLPKAIGEEFESRFGLRGVEMWGMTETACPLWTSLDGERPLGSCGRVMEEWAEVIVVDPETDRALPAGEVGELAVRPRHPWTMMSRYMGMPEETLKAWRNLWFHTGDAAMRDEAGNFFIVDRLKDRIRRRAENISSFDIEAVALKRREVREAAAIGVPSGMEGDDDIKLCISLVEGAEIVPDELIVHLAERLPHFMVPRYIEIVEALPRTPTNKVRKADLRNDGVTDATWDRHKAGIRLKEITPPR